MLKNESSDLLDELIFELFTLKLIKNFPDQWFRSDFSFWFFFHENSLSFQPLSSMAWFSDFFSLVAVSWLSSGSDFASKWHGESVLSSPTANAGGKAKSTELSSREGRSILCRAVAVSSKDSSIEGTESECLWLRLTPVSGSLWLAISFSGSAMVANGKLGGWEFAKEIEIHLRTD